MEPQIHWQNIYQTKDTTQVSWYQEHAGLSLRLIQETGVAVAGHIIDVGGGASILVDDLLAAGYQQVSVLDISGTALDIARNRLGARASAVTWIEADITQVDLPHHAYDVWHDRATFHFLTQPEDRQRYVRVVQHAVKPGGHVIVATFALDGPSQCSGLHVMQFNADSLHNEFGDDFKLIDSLRESHRTPFGTEQHFVYCYCRLG
jgi:2-polyprenyl-3-methyl-5-hydroxy-6-metoxy-1,4-benzoquinol methylase